MPNLDQILRGVDDAGKGLSKEDFTTSIRNKVIKERIAIGVVGQSTELGAVADTDRAAYPLAFQSIQNSSVTVPFPPSDGYIDRGGYWCYVYDKLFEWGYHAEIVNGAIGGSSFLQHWPGYMQTWAANTRYASKRSPQGVGDWGDFGDLIKVGSSIFNCISGGMTRYAVNSGPERTLSGGIAYLDSISGLNTGGTSAGSQPNFAGVAVDGTITDGALTWKRLTDVYSGALSNVLTDNVAAMVGRGFDPMGLLQRTHIEMMRIKGVSRKIIYISHGQTNLGVGSTTYRDAIRSIAYFFLKRGYEVAIGLTLYSPGASLSSITNYNALATGVNDAYSMLSSEYPGKVWLGANLFQSMGSTGPMGGANFIGSVASNVLTVSQVNTGGTGLAVGQRVATAAGALIGTITSFGTGSGGLGTYNLSGGIDTGSSTMRSVGSFLQLVDGVHINGAGSVGPDVSGVSCAGKYVSDSLKAILPQLI